MRQLYFCFPFRGVGGVPILFLRVAEHIAAAGLAKCYLIDYVDGYMAINRDPSITELIEYNDISKVHIPKNSSIVFQSITPWSMFPNLDIHASAKVLFWNCHPLNLIPSLPGFRTVTSRDTMFSKLVLNTVLINFTKKVREFLTYLLDKNAIVFMDGTNLQVTCDFLDISIKNPNFLPIPVKPLSNNNFSRSKIGDGVIRFIWVGRIVDFKYYPLKRFLKDLSEIATKSETKFELIIVGDGEYIDSLRKEALKPKYKLLNITFIKYIDYKNLDAFIMKNADILIGMGTSALEGAKLGVPTLLFDFSYIDILGAYKYRWVHESNNFNLAEMIGMKNSNLSGDTLREKVDEFQTYHDQISLKDFEYYLENHEISAVVSKLINFLDKTKCEYGKLKLSGFFSRGFLYSSFYATRKLLRSNKR